MKILTMGDMKRLRGEAAKSTHLARYEAANEVDAKQVLDVKCTECVAPPGTQCFGGS